MTPEELTQDIQKFLEYLYANGVRTIASSYYVELDKAGPIVMHGGTPEMQDELAIKVLAHNRGLL